MYALMLGVLEPSFHTIPYQATDVLKFWGYWIMGDLGWQPSWGRILGEETRNRDKFGGVAGLQWCSEGRCQSHMFEASPGNHSPRDVCWLCIRPMPWRRWIFSPKCGSIPFTAWGIWRVIQKYAFVFSAAAELLQFASICIPCFTGTAFQNHTVTFSLYI